MVCADHALHIARGTSLRFAPLRLCTQTKSLVQYEEAASLCHKLPKHRLRASRSPLSAGSGIPTAQRVPSTAIVPVDRIGADAKETEAPQNPQLSQLFALAKLFGYALSPLQALRKELSHSISTRLVTRVGIDVYQAAAYSLPMFPREAAIEIVPEGLKTLDTPAVVTWHLGTCADVVSTLSPILILSERCAGVSRALQTPSESVIRVIATLLPDITISYVKKKGLDRLFVNFDYLLSDQAGELHPPKDNNRIREGDATRAGDGDRRCASRSSRT
jgi:hypothetical protein